MSFVFVWAKHQIMFSLIVLCLISHFHMHFAVLLEIHDMRCFVEFVPIIFQIVFACCKRKCVTVSLLWFVRWCGCHAYCANCQNYYSRSFCELPQTSLWSHFVQGRLQKYIVNGCWLNLCQFLAHVGVLLLPMLGSRRISFVEWQSHFTQSMQSSL